MEWLTTLTGLLEITPLPAEIGAIVADGAIKLTVVLLLASVATVFLRGESAAVRHAVWAMALGAGLMVPVLSGILPAWRIVPLPAPWRASQDRVSPAPPAPAIAVVAGGGRANVASFGVAASAVPAVSVGVVGEASAPTVVRLAPVPPPLPSTPALPSGAVAEPEWAQMVLTVWWVGAVLVLAALGFGVVRVWQLGRDAVAVTDPRWSRLLAEVCGELGIERPVRLRASRHAFTPMTWGLVRPTVLLPASSRTWSPQQRHDVLVHELAHVQRYDYLIQILARYTCAIYWFNPLVWWATRQLRIEREQACDDAVLAAGGRASGYARHLLELAKGMRAPVGSALGSVAMARRSHLAQRLDAVLDQTRHRQPLTGPAAVAGWAMASLVVVPLAAVHPVDEEPRAPVPRVPVVAVQPAAVAVAPRVEVVPPTPVVIRGVAPPAAGAYAGLGVSSVIREQQGRCAEPGGSHSYQHVSNDDSRRVTWRHRDDCEGDVRIRGTVDFTADFTDIRRISRGGSFRIEVDDGEVERRIEVRPGNDGNLERRWFVDGRERPYDDVARAWFEQALRDFFRHSSLLLDERVAWILETRGVAGLLEEATLVYGAHLKRRLYAAALETGEMGPDDVRAVLARAAEEISSDHELSRLLESVPAAQLADPTVRQAYVQAAGTITSDFEKRRVLVAVLEQDDLSDALVVDLLTSARDIQSDFELATLMTAIGPRYLHNRQLRATYLRTADGIESNFELRKVLSTLLDQRNLDAETRLALLGMAPKIESDFELASLLTVIARDYAVDEGTRAAFFQAVNTIGSDFERAKVLKTLFRSDLSEAVIVDLLHSSAGVDSDFELAGILVDVPTARLAREDAWMAFIAAVARLDSDHERRRVLAPMARTDGWPTARAIALVDLAAAMDSDHDKAAVLTDLARHYGGVPEVREALMRAADTIDSDTEHRRVTRLLRRTSGN